MAFQTCDDLAPCLVTATVFVAAGRNPKRGQCGCRINLDSQDTAVYLCWIPRKRNWQICFLAELREKFKSAVRPIIFLDRLAPSGCKLRPKHGAATHVDLLTGDYADPALVDQYRADQNIKALRLT